MAYRKYIINPLNKGKFDIGADENALNSEFVNKGGDTMTGDLSFNNASINNVNTVGFNTNNTESLIEGVLGYNQNSASVELGLGGGNVSVAIGKELVLPRRVRNNDLTSMPKGTVVYISGVSGNTPVVSRAIATSDSTSAFTIGITAENIAPNNTGWVLTNGVLSDINLSTYNNGDILYLSGTNAGEFTTVKPQAPIHYVRIGEVVKATSSGEMIVTIQNGFELDELHNVQINAVSTGQILQYQTDGLWKNVSPLYMKYFGEHNIDPTGISPINGDQYWNNLDERMQVYINRWRELNGADRFQFTNGDDFQFTDTRYFQFTR